MQKHHKADFNTNHVSTLIYVNNLHHVSSIIKNKKKESIKAGKPLQNPPKLR